MPRKAVSLVDLERDVGIRGKLRDFVEMAWPTVEPDVPCQGNWHIDAVCDHLEAITRGELFDLVIAEPPGCMKSMLVQVFWQPWEWIRNPGSRWGSASFDGGLTLRDARKSLQIMRSPWYQARWGDIVKVPETAADGDFSNLRGGSRFSTSVRGKVTGRHFNRFNVDDATKPLEVTKTALEQIETWWRGTLKTRIAPGGSRCVIGQRLHERDLPGVCIADGFTLLRLPMEFESKFPCVTNWGGDMRTEEGELLWPSRFGPESIAALKRDLGSAAYAAQEQQRPVPEGGGIFKREWFRHWTVNPVVAVPNATVKTVPVKFDAVVISVDAAFKDLPTSDYVVLQVWGRKGPILYLLDQVRDRLDFGATCAALRKLISTWPTATAKLIEDKANGSAIISTLRKEIPGIIPINPEGGKVARANAVVALHEAGNVYDPDPAVTPWVGPMRDELTSFPFGAHDDTVDARSQALTWMLTHSTTSLIEAMDALKMSKYANPPRL